MHNFVLFAILGLGAGDVYAILGLGIVLVYKGSGIVNFSQGAIGMGGTYVFLSLTEAGLPTYLALFLALIASFIFGLLVHYVLFARLQSAPMLAKLVATLGLLLAVQGVIEVIYGDSPATPVAVLPQTPVSLFGVTFGQDNIWLLGIAVVLAVLLWVIYRYTRFGLVTRAAAENEKAAEVLGYSADTVAAVNWGLGSALATLACVLIAPITSLSPTAFTLLILPALAAAVLGRFGSFSIVTAVGVLLGIVSSLVTGGVINVFPSVISSQGVTDLLPLIVILIALMVTGRLPSRGVVSEGRLPFAPAPKLRVFSIRRLSLVVAGVVLLVVLTQLLSNSGKYQSAVTTGVIFAVVGLSVVLITGLVGQVSLAQLTFAGVGAFAAAKFASSFGIPFIWTILLAGLVTMPVGLLMGLPALRIRGVNLAIVTLGGAVAINSVVFENPRWGGGALGLSVPQPEILGWSLNSDLYPARFAGAAAIVLAIMYLLMVAVRRGSTGRKMLAVRGNERSAEGSGIDVRAVKLGAFALASFMTGVAGALYAYQNTNVTFDAFSPIGSIFFFASVYIAGIASLSGGLLIVFLAAGGIGWTYLDHFSFLTQWQDLLSGVVLLLTVVLNPDGIAVNLQRQASWVRRRLGGGEGTVQSASPPLADTATSSLVPAELEEVGGSTVEVE
jgi:branched-subunit amino acid ABC-type transport system permease component